MITFLDDDAFIQEDYLEVCVKAFEAESKMDALGGKILLHYESIIPKWENKFINSLLGFLILGILQWHFQEIIIQEAQT